MNDVRPTHLDIFSGIGGFAIAAQEAGFETVAFCESDSRCREFLEKRWGKPVHPDIRTFDAKPYRGVSLLTGGPPCQPASRAGKQGGETDDRWLWPEALRVLAEAEPDCVVFENPPGIGDVGLDGILSEMGGLGYEVQPFDIPACAVDSPQLRHRFWIVGFRVSDSARQRCGEGGAEPATARRTCAGANSEHMANPSRDSENESNAIPDAGGDSSMANTRCERSGQDEQERGAEGRAVDRRDCENELADSEDLHGRREQQPGESAEQWWARFAGSPWQNSVWVPCADGKLRRAPDDSFGLVDGLHRSLLAALGNSICPEVAIPILRACRQIIETWQNTSC